MNHRNTPKDKFNVAEILTTKFKHSNVTGKSKCLFCKTTGS